MNVTRYWTRMEKGVPAKVSKTLWTIRRQRGRYIVAEKEIKCYSPTYRIYSIKHPGRLLNFWTLRVSAYARLDAY